VGDITINYRFALDSDKEQDFDVVLDAKTLALKDAAPEQRPEWAKLGFYKCPICPLDEKETPYCPVALAAYRPVVIFKDFLAYDEAVVHITAPERSYAKRVPLAMGLSSLVGIYMVTCGCPVLDWLRPMVRHHLPFATEDETLIRAMGMYLVAQHLVEKQGGEPDWGMKGLQKIYDNVMAVNKAFLLRLQNTPVKDASLNAIITLDCFAMNVSFTLEGEPLSDLRTVFRKYL
jgi:hypothetical protein